MALTENEKIIQNTNNLQADTQVNSLVASNQDEQSVPIVGIGASAGGLDALERFFQNTPLDSGMAFVVVQHLAPDFNSLMDELLARHTDLPIHEVKNGMDVTRNTIYLLPPRANMIYISGQLRLSERETTDVLNLPIDVFLRSLAQGMGTRAIGVILSGTGSDGSQGVKELQRAGGLIAVQDPTTALFDGMPRNAINTRTVHIIAPPEDLSAKIIAHVANQILNGESALPIPPLINSDYAESFYAISHSEGADKTQLSEENELSIILSLLRSHFQIDFSQYKPETVLRRIQRRITISRGANAADYLRLLQNNQSEVDTLYRDLLIDVTRFFRDPLAFEALKPLIDKMVTSASLDNDIRVWVAGCATGEEAYTLAILFAEALKMHDNPAQVQIFATDAHPESLAIASKGCYSSERVAGMPAELAEKYLLPVIGDDDTENFVVSDTIRQMIVFAQHNLLQDPPFTRLSLVTCRNVLIYFKPHAQERILSQFFFGLKTGGTLFLGPSEHIGHLKDNFHIEEQRWRIFTKYSARNAVKHAVLTTGYQQNSQLPRRPTALPPKSESTKKLNLYESLIDSQMPSSLLVNERYELVRTFGDAGKYLRIAGNPSYQILDLVDVELGTALRAGFHRAKQDKKAVVYSGVHFPKNLHKKNADKNPRTQPSNAEESTVDADSFIRLRVKVTPFIDDKFDQNYFLVSLTENVPLKQPGVSAQNGAKEGPEPTKQKGTHRTVPADKTLDTIDADYVDADYVDADYVDAANVDTDNINVDYIHADFDQASRDQFTLLENELIDTKEYLQTTVEELETTNEEMQSTNEELIASNEELQSTNEELHSVNEELYTVNTEYQRKIDELQLLSDDMANLQNSTQIATLFLDKSLCVRHYTPAVTEIVHLLPQDIERPVEHLRPDIDLEQKIFIDYLETVLQDKFPIEIEVMHREHTRLLMRILPYYTYKDEADGVVVTFTDITSIHDVQEALLSQQKLTQSILSRNPTHIDLFDIEDKRRIEIDKDVREKLGYTRAEIEAMPTSLLLSVGHPDDREAIDEWHSRLASLPYDNHLTREFRFLHKDGSWRWFLRTVWVHEQDNAGNNKLLAGTLVDITEQKAVEEELSAQQKLTQSILEHSSIHFDLFDLREMKRVVIGKDFREQLGYSQAEIKKMPARLLDAIGHPDEREIAAEWRATIASLPSDEYTTQEFRLRHKNGSWRWFLRTVWVYEQEEDGTARLLAGTQVDITKQKEITEVLASRERLLTELTAMSPIYIYLFDNSTEEYIYVNRDVRKELGYSEAEIAKMQSGIMATLAHPEDQAKVSTLNEQLASMGPNEAIRHNVRLRHKDGSWRYYLRSEIVYERDEAGQIKLIKGTATDVTSFRRLEDKMRKSESLNRHLTDHATDAIYLIDMQGNVIDCNKQAEREFGYSYAELTALPIDDIQLDFDQQSTFEQIINLPEGESFNYLATYVCQDGSHLEAENRCIKIIRDHQTLLLTSAKNLSAINQLKEMDGKLSSNNSEVDALLHPKMAAPMEREQRMKLLYEITSHIATDVELQLSEALRLAARALDSQYAAIGRIDDNTYLVRHLFASGSEMQIGQALPLDETYCSINLEQGDVLVIDHMADSRYAERLCYKRMGFESYIGTMIKVNGMPYGNVCFFGESSKSPPYTKADEDFVRLLAGWIGFAIERLRTDSAHAVQSVSLEATNAELMRSNQDLDTFVYIASHDLKEPLRGINQYAQFLEEDYAHRLDNEGIHMLTALREQSSRAEQLIEDLRFYSRIGRTELGLEEINLNTLIGGVLAQIQSRLNENDVEIIVADDLPTVVYNHARLSTVFQNLIVNAIKYNVNPKKRVEVGIFYAGSPPEIEADFNRSDLPTEDLGDVDIDLLSQLSYGVKEANSPLKMPWMPEGEPILYVRDNGIGIKERNIARIFGMFKRLHGNDQYGGGTGAGLPIVRRILERNGGHIWVESTVGEGTQFNFTLGKVPISHE